MDSGRRPLDRARFDVRPLTAGDVDALASFSCGDADLDDFLRSDALRLQEQNIVRVYLGVCEGELAGYVALLADAVVLRTDERKKIRLTHDDAATIPALKVARLATSASFRATYRGAGEALMQFAFDQALALAETVGCRLLTVDAYPESAAFYRRLSFVPNRASLYLGREHPSMRFDLFPPELPRWVRA